MNKDWLTEPAHADEARLADTRDTADTVCGMVTVAKIRHRTRHRHTRDPNTAGHTEPVTNPTSVPCERLFSEGKEIADDRRSRLGAARFEELQMLKFTWRDFQIDHAALTSSELEELDLDEFEGLLEADIKFSEFDIDAAIETYVVE